jgi:hypothetical protein
MAKRLKASAKASPPATKYTRGKLSLYPLDFEGALGAALKTGPMPKKSKDKKHKTKP